MLNSTNAKKINHINHTYRVYRLWSECSFEFVRSAIIVLVFCLCGHELILSLCASMSTFVYTRVYVCLWERKRLAIMADWPDTLQEVLWNISGLRGRVRGWVGGGGLAGDPYSLPTIHWLTRAPRPLLNQSLAILTPAKPPHVTRTLMLGIISDVMVAAFLFVALNARRGLLVSWWKENGWWQTQSSVCIDSWLICEFFLHQVLPYLSIFLLHVCRKEEVEPTSVSYTPPKCISTVSTS